MTFPLAAPASPALSFPATAAPLMVGTAVPVPAANDAHWMRVYGRGPITKIGLHVGASSGSISLAVYRRNGAGRNAIPGTRLITTGAIPCPAVGYAEVSLGGSVTVEDGDFFCLTCDNTTATFRPTDSGYVGTTDIGKGVRYAQLNAHPAPATPAPVPVLGRTLVLVGVA